MMIGDALLNSISADAAAATKLFPNQGLHRAAEAFAASHPRAIQYLEQAPVLVFGARAGGVSVRRVNLLYLQHKLTPLCERGAKLSEVMRAFDLAPVTRRLVGSALVPSVEVVVFALSRMPAAELGNAIPVRRGAQRRWLAALAAWRKRISRNHGSPDHCWAWAAREFGRCGVAAREAEDMADFAATADGGFSEAWQWPRAAQEMARWHATLNLGRAMKGMVIKPETVIDLGPHPDVWTLADYSFEALRTPIAIVAEGATMHHCVATYLNQVMGGQCHIISIKRDGDPIATLEIRAGRMTQLKGKYNAKPAMTAEAAARLYSELWLSTWAKPKPRRS